tara:strand:- start:7269 stop:7634 length:366 start_codon:yes stop_codon:yes gene_type:complete
LVGLWHFVEQGAEEAAGVEQMWEDAQAMLEMESLRRRCRGWEHGREQLAPPPLLRRRILPRTETDRRRVSVLAWHSPRAETAAAMEARERAREREEPHLEALGLRGDDRRRDHRLILHRRE